MMNQPRQSLGPVLVDAKKFEDPAAFKTLEIDILARTVWGEARGASSDRMKAVANVVLNRAEIAQENGGRWWGNNIIQICLKPYQFPCWNRSSLFFKKMQMVDDSNLYFTSARSVATRACLDALADNTAGATFYHSEDKTPYWARGETPSAYIDGFYFYRLGA